VKSQSPEVPTLQDHEETRRRYVALSWELLRSQIEQRFFVWHPIPEEHLRIEVVMFWRGEISRIHGWNNVVGQVVDAVVAPIKSFFVWCWENLIRPGIDVLLRTLRGALELAINALKPVINGILGVINWIKQSIMGIVTQIAQGLTWLAGKVTEGVGWIWNQVQGFFSALGEVLKQIGTWIINAIKTYVVDPILGLLRPVFDALKQLILGLWNFITGGAITGSPVEWRGSYLRWLGILSGVGVMAVSGLIGAELINLVHPFKDTKAGEIAKFAMQFSGIAFLQAAFFTTYFDIACAKPVRQELNSIFTPELPGSGDLIRFVVREVIVPDEFYMAMALQGFSRYWSGAYWEAHWVLPDPERTRTAFLRKQIPEEAYRKFLIWYDFKPEPRPGIPISDVDIMLKTQYDWPGRIDTRWLLEWGSITPEQGVDLVKASGMDPAWAPRLVEVYILNQIREELGKVRTVYEKALREGFLDPMGFAEKLVGIHYAPHVINALRIWADEELALAEKLELAAEYEKLAKDEVITPGDLAAGLRELGMVETRITRKVNYVNQLLAVKVMKAAAKAKG